MSIVTNPNTSIQILPNYFTNTSGFVSSVSSASPHQNFIHDLFTQIDAQNTGQIQFCELNSILNEQAIKPYDKRAYYTVQDYLNDPNKTLNFAQFEKFVQNLQLSTVDVWKLTELSTKNDAVSMNVKNPRQEPQNKTFTTTKSEEDCKITIYKGKHSRRIPED